MAKKESSYLKMDLALNYNSRLDDIFFTPKRGILNIILFKKSLLSIIGFMLITSTGNAARVSTVQKTLENLVVIMPTRQVLEEAFNQAGLDDLITKTAILDHLCDKHTTAENITIEVASASRAYFSESDHTPQDILSLQDQIYTLLSTVLIDQSEAVEAIYYCKDHPRNILNLKPLLKAQYLFEPVLGIQQR